ncbi:MAG: type VI secretion system contractile sheath large subunit, partial [Deferrisomatales bacterium]|nr:type VI secretion system contractile sheath large subunit [Deferrisomatales bacterium]
MPTRLEFKFDLGRATPPRDEGGARRGAMRLLVMGDFSGRPAAERPPLASRPTQRVDLDNLDDVLRRLAPRLTLPSGELRFEEIEDFHPDALYSRFGLFDALRQARGKPPAAPGDLLDSLLGKPAKAAAPAAPSTGIDAFIHRIVAPHIVPDAAAQTQSYTAAVDSAIAEQMRQLLHDPAFQRLEAAWRGVQWLIFSLELNEDLQLHLFDVSRDELVADVVAAQGQPARTGLYGALADRWRNAPGGEGWSALVGLYRFGTGDADIGLLAALGLVAAQAGGPLLAEADPTLAGDDNPALVSWQTLRRSDAAPSIGLAAPRILLRQPYGKDSDPIAAFGFEEFVGTPAHEEFLWGNPGLAVALLIGRAFSARGWQFEPGDEREIGELPAYVVVQDGEKELQACAERYLGERGGQALLKAGLMPVLSHRHRNAVTVMRFQSVAEPAT